MQEAGAGPQTDLCTCAQNSQCQRAHLLLSYKSAFNKFGGYLQSCVSHRVQWAPTFVLIRCGQILRYDYDHQEGKMFVYIHRSPNT